MEIRNKIVYTNVHKYKVTDKDCENLCMKSVLYGIGRVIVGPSSLPGVVRMLKDQKVEIGVTVSYPSGAYFPEAKESEAKELVERYPQIGAIYMVMAVGRFLSGYAGESAEEMRKVKQAAGVRKVYVILEAAVMDDEQLGSACDLAVENGMDGVVDTAGFQPYDVPFPSAEDTKRLVRAAAGRLPVIAGYIRTPRVAEEKIGVGADSVIMTDIDELI